MGNSVSNQAHGTSGETKDIKDLTGSDDGFNQGQGVLKLKDNGDSDCETVRECVDERLKTSTSSDKPPGHEFRRCLTKKANLITDKRMFQMVDHHARHTPEEMSFNAERLVTYLMSSCTSIMHTVRILYMWITLNIRCISYTDESLAAFEFKPTTVLSKREATPVGMNLLFYYFCSQIRIPCSLVHGILKQDNQHSSFLRQMKNKPNHAWVLVLVQDQWRFIDCACGGGGSDDDLKEAALRREFFFLPDPESLINSHFPIGMTNEMEIQGFPDTEISNCLQMLEKPFSFGQFWRQAMKSLTGLKISLQLLTHLSCVVRIDKGELLAFRSPELDDIAGILTDKNTGQAFPHSVLCMRTSSSEYRVFVKPEKPGSYKLEILGKLRGYHEHAFHKLTDYEVISDIVEDKFSPFPNHFGIWGANNKAIQFGFSRRIFKFDTLTCRTGDLYMKLPLTNQVRVKAVLTPATSTINKIQDTTHNNNTSNNNYKTEHHSNTSTLTMYMDGVVHIKARFDSPGFFSLSLHAQTQHPPGQLLALTTSSPFTKVADFMVSCRRRSAYASPLPKSFAMSQQFHCLLLEPLQKDLIAHRVYQFRVAAPCMEVMKVDGQIMEMEARSRDDCNDDDVISDVWTLQYTPKTIGSSVYIYGAVKRPNDTGSGSGGPLSALFVYHVLEDVAFGHNDDDSDVIII